MFTMEIEVTRHNTQPATLFISSSKAERLREWTESRIGADDEEELLCQPLKPTKPPCCTLTVQCESPQIPLVWLIIHSIDNFCDTAILNEFLPKYATDFILWNFNTFCLWIESEHCFFLHEHTLREWQTLTLQSAYLITLCTTFVCRGRCMWCARKMIRCSSSSCFLLQA